MSTSDFVMRDDLSFSSQLNNLAAKLPQYHLQLGLQMEDIMTATNAAAHFSWTMDQVKAHAERKKTWTTFKDLLRNPGAGVPPLTEAPGTLNVMPPPAAVELGIETWLRQLAKRIKGSKGYTEAIGQDLGLVPMAASATRLGTPKPVFSLSLVAGQPLITWKKGAMDGVEIYKDSGDGNFRLLVVDLRPNHLDTSELPKPGTTARWSYKMIYRFRDDRIGEWSDVASIMVAGEV